MTDKENKDNPRNEQWVSLRKRILEMKEKNSK